MALREELFGPAAVVVAVDGPGQVADVVAAIGGSLTGTVHYPSSTSASHTSVGTGAIRRFLRPVTYQDFPDGLLPPALADANPWGISRAVDGRRTTDPIEH